MPDPFQNERDATYISSSNLKEYKIKLMTQCKGEGGQAIAQKVKV